MYTVKWRQEQPDDKKQETRTRLYDLRSQRGLTQVRVQIETGIDQSDYSKMERGHRQPSYEQAIRLCRLFDTSMDYLYGLTDDPRPYPRSAAFKKEDEK